MQKLICVQFDQPTNTMNVSHYIIYCHFIFLLYVFLFLSPAVNLINIMSDKHSMINLLLTVVLVYQFTCAHRFFDVYAMTHLFFTLLLSLSLTENKFANNLANREGSRMKQSKAEF